MIVNTELSVAAGQAPADPWSGQIEQPANVIRQDEVPGRTHDMGAKYSALVNEAVDRSIGDASRALPECPFSTGIILCLHGAKQAHHVDRRCQWLSNQPQSMESSCREIDHSSVYLRSFVVASSPSDGLSN
jgi:hypothetical protein